MADRPQLIETARLDALHAEAVRLADTARAWFDGPGQTLAASAPPAVRARIAAASLATTARLMSAMAWLLHPGHAAGTPPPFRPQPAPPPPQPPLAGTPGAALAEAAHQLTIRLQELAP